MDDQAKPEADHDISTVGVLEVLGVLGVQIQIKKVPSLHIPMLASGMGISGECILAFRRDTVCVLAKILEQTRDLWEKTDAEPGQAQRKKLGSKKRR